MADTADTPDSIRVAIADDAFLMREAIGQVLARAPRIEVVAVCEDGDSLLAAVRRESPTVVVTDIRMPPSGDDEGIRVARSLRLSHPGVGVVVLSQYADPRYGLALFEPSTDARAYLLKDRIHEPGSLLTAVDTVARGGSMIDAHMLDLLMGGRERAGSVLGRLTPRERDVLAEMAQGRSNTAIGERLGLSRRAVEKHVGAIFLGLGLEPEREERVSRRVAAVLTYLEETSARPPPP